MKIAPEASGVVVRVSRAPSDPRAVSRVQSARQKLASRVSRAKVRKTAANVANAIRRMASAARNELPMSISISLEFVLFVPRLPGRRC